MKKLCNCSKGWGEVTKTRGPLDAFLGGGIAADSGIEISETKVVQFLGQGGPICMSLVQVSSPGLLWNRTKAKRTKLLFSGGLS